jgi:hypothetical protein
MKEITLPSRISMFVTTIMDSLAGQEELSTKSLPGKETIKRSRNRPDRKDYFYYTQIIDHDTHEIIGHLSDISSGGFKLDSQKQVPINRDFQFRMNLTSEVADKPFMVFMARSRWCQVDPIDPYVYNVGCQLTQISPADLEIFNRMMEKYGREYSNRNFDLRRSNKW